MAFPSLLVKVKSVQSKCCFKSGGYKVLPSITYSGGERGDTTKGWGLCGGGPEEQRAALQGLLKDLL